MCGFGWPTKTICGPGTYILEYVRPFLARVADGAVTSFSFSDTSAYVLGGSELLLASMGFGE
jgi:hypothetical protein